MSKKNDTVELDKKGVKALRVQLELQKELYELKEAKLSLKDKKLSSRKYHDVVKREMAGEQRHGIFRVYGYVLADSCETLETNILNYARRNPGGDITLLIRTGGGDVFSGLALYDSLRTLSEAGHHITTVGRGIVASFGGILLQAGDTRLLGKESYLMIHELAAGTGGKLHEIRDDARFYKKLDRRLNKIMTERTEMTADELGKKITATDWWIPAKAAIRLGFADEVG